MQFEQFVGDSVEKCLSTEENTVPSQSVLKFDEGVVVATSDGRVDDSLVFNNSCNSVSR